jgi:hypothetical protein
MPAMTRDYLFAGANLDERLRSTEQSASDSVQAIPEAQFLASSDDEIVAHIKAQWTLEPLNLQENAAKMEKRESDVDVSADPNRFFFPEDRHSPHYIFGTEVIIQIPYTGATWLWQATTNPSTTRYPIGIVQAKGDEAGEIRLRIALPHDASSQRFKQLHDENMELIRTFIEWGGVQVNNYNQRLDPVIRRSVAQRRQRLQHHGDLAALLLSISENDWRGRLTGGRRTSHDCDSVERSGCYRCTKACEQLPTCHRAQVAHGHLPGVSY